MNQSSGLCFLCQRALTREYSTNTFGQMLTKSGLLKGDYTSVSMGSPVLMPPASPPWWLTFPESTLRLEGPSHSLLHSNNLVYPDMSPIELPSWYPRKPKFELNGSQGPWVLERPVKSLRDVILPCWLFDPLPVSRAIFTSVDDGYRPNSWLARFYRVERSVRRVERLAPAKAFGKLIWFGLKVLGVVK